MKHGVYFFPFFEFYKSQASRVIERSFVIRDIRYTHSFELRFGRTDNYVAEYYCEKRCGFCGKWLRVAWDTESSNVYCSRIEGKICEGEIDFQQEQYAQELYEQEMQQIEEQERYHQLANEWRRKGWM